MGLLNSIFGDKPEFADVPEINLQSEARKTITANQANLPAATQLAETTAAANQTNLLRSLERVLPTFTSILKRQASVVDSQLRGELTPEVEATLKQRAAQRGVAGGFAGSAFADNVTARSLGLNQLQLQQAGLQNAAALQQQALQLSPVMPVQSMFLTPQQALQAAMQRQQLQFQRDLAQAQADAAPDPVASGLFKFGSSIGGAAIGGLVAGAMLRSGANTGFATDQFGSFSGLSPGMFAGATNSAGSTFQGPLRPGGDF
jgi:hypothetical protein